MRQLAALSVALSLLSPPAASQSPPEFRFAREDVLGTSSLLLVRAKDEATAKRAEAAVLAEVQRASAVVSTWQPDAELARLVAAGGGNPSAELAKLLQTAAGWRERSHGAFDPGVAALTRLWHEAAATGAEPAPAALAAAVEKLRPGVYTLRDGALKVAGPLTFDAIAKGWIVDRAVAATSAVEGVTLVSFQIGGDAHVGKDATTVALTDPRHPAENGKPLASVRIAGLGLASSGSYARGFDIGGKHFSHILDPRSGKPCDGVLGASVIAKDTATADALATTLCVLGPQAGFELLASEPGAHAIVVTADGQVHRSPGFAAFEVAAPAAVAATATKNDGPWPAGFALQIDFEIKAPAAAASGRGRGGWKRPYVAVWIEDVTGAPAKTLCLWIENRRWLRDLRRWSRLNEDTPGLTDLVSQATRKAGAYTLAWDGKDDDGRALAPGKYFVCIEATREHGTYQLMRREIELRAEPQAIAIEGNDEIAQAKLTFGPAAPGGGK